MTPIESGRPRRRGLALAAAAAGILVVGGGTVAALKGGSDTGVTSSAQPPAAQQDSSIRKGAAPSSAGVGSAPSRSMPSLGAPDTSPTIVSTITVSGDDITPATVNARAKDLTTTTPSTLLPGQAESPGIGPLGTPKGVTDCLQGLGVTGAREARVQVGTYQSQPTALVVTRDGSGRWTAYVVGRGCNASSPDTIVGATPVV